MLLMIMLPLCFKLCEWSYHNFGHLLVKYFELKSCRSLTERISILFETSGKKKKVFILVEEFVLARSSETFVYEDFVLNSKTKLYSFG